MAMVLWLVACGRPPVSEEVSPPPPPPAESGGTGFLTLRPPAKPEERPAEVVRPALPKLVIIHGGWPLPEEWLKEWKGERGLNVKQRGLMTGEAQIPAEASLVVLPPHRLAGVLGSRQLRVWRNDPGEGLANPLFLHHPYDPEQRVSRPWRWAPMVIHHRAEGGEKNGPEAGLIWNAEEGMLWPDDPLLVKGFWKKSRGYSANHGGGDAGWARVESDLLPVMLPVATVWERFQNGGASRCWLPSAARGVAVPEAEGGVRGKWTIPAHGTLIHLDLLAVPAGAPLAEEAEDLVRFLTSAAIQDRMGAETGWLPVHRPFARLTADAPVPLPVGDWLDRSEILYPAGQFALEEKSATPVVPAGPAGPEVEGAASGSPGP